MRSSSPATGRCSRRGRSTRCSSSRASSQGRRNGWRSPRLPDRGFSDAVVDATSRRGFLAGAGRLLLAVSGGGLVAGALRAQAAEAYHFCGHTYTTGSCPHPTGLPRIDALGYPLRAADGKAVDDLGRLVDGQGRPVDEHGHLLLDPDGQPLPPTTRTRICQAAGKRFGFRSHIDGAWYRCCGGHVRKLIDCCGYKSTRINGDAALTGYCYSGRKVFCVHYYDTKIRC